jgi:hypothetical protein
VGPFAFIGLLNPNGGQYDFVFYEIRWLNVNAYPRYGQANYAAENDSVVFQLAFHESEIIL